MTDPVELTELFWDCECEDTYINPKRANGCQTCGAFREDQPDSRVPEVIQDFLVPEVILQSADPSLCQRPGLQVAYDRLMLVGKPENIITYAELWKMYISMGGVIQLQYDRATKNVGIDLDNWTRLKERFEKKGDDNEVADNR